MKKTLISVVAVSLAIAAIWTGRQQATVIVAKDQISASANPPAAAVANPADTQPSSPTIMRQELSLSATGRYSTDHQHTDEPVMPEDLAREIEAKRIAASELKLKAAKNGYSMETQGQFHTVVVAYIGADGKLHKAEKLVQPIPDTTIILPPPPADSPARP